MYLTYRPEGSDTQRWQVQLGRLRTFDLEAIERVTGMDYGAEFKQKLLQGNGKARRALLWVLLRRDHPMIKFADVDFADDELQLEQDRDELAVTRAEIAGSEELDPVRKATLLASIDRQLPEAPEPPGKAVVSSCGSGTP